MGSMYLCGVCGYVVYAEARRSKMSHPRRTQAEAGPQEVVKVCNRYKLLALFFFSFCFI